MASPDAPGKLAGKRIIVTRAHAQAAPLIARLSALGAEAVSLPLIAIGPPSDSQPLDRVIARIETFDWLILSSANAVEYFLRRFDQLSGDRRRLSGSSIAAVGPKTRDRIEREGLNVTIMPDRYLADSLVMKFVEHYRDRERLRGLRALIPASNITRDAIRPALADLGVDVELVEAYRTVPPDLSRSEAMLKLDPQRGGYLLFASPSVIDHLAKVLNADNLAPLLGGLRIVCIGPTTAEAAARRGLCVDLMPDEYRIESLMELIADTI